MMSCCVGVCVSRYIAQTAFACWFSFEGFVLRGFDGDVVLDEEMVKIFKWVIAIQVEEERRPLWLFNLENVSLSTRVMCERKRMPRQSTGAEKRVVLVMRTFWKSKIVQ